MSDDHLGPNWPTCVNCAKTRGVDCDRKKDVGRGVCRRFVPTIDNKLTEGKV